MVNSNWYICTTHKSSVWCLLAFPCLQYMCHFSRSSYIPHIQCLSILNELTGKWCKMICRKLYATNDTGFHIILQYLVGSLKQGKLLNVIPVDFRWEVICLHVLSLHFHWSNVYAYQEILEINSYPGADTDIEPM